MEQERIERALADAPAWAKIGLTMPSEKMRDRAAKELAACISATLEQPVVTVDANQLPLPL